MNRILLSLTPVVAVCTALGQTPAAPPEPSSNIITETGKIARVLAGPGDRPQGFLLRNGTFVVLPPGLSRRMPPTLSTNTSVRVAGDEFTYHGNRTIQARHILLAGISYDDVAPAVPAPPSAVTATPPPPIAPGPARASVPPPCPSVLAPTPPAPPTPPAVRTPHSHPAAPPPPPAE